MRLTTKGRFAVTAMVDPAMSRGKHPVTLAAISQRQKISLPYLEQLFGKLRRFRLVRLVTYDSDLAKIYRPKSGIFFQNCDLNREERRVIGEEFRKMASAVNAIMAITTLAMGGISLCP